MAKLIVGSIAVLGLSTMALAFQMSNDYHKLSMRLYREEVRMDQHIKTINQHDKAIEMLIRQTSNLAPVYHVEK